jgi:hypothetical protein
MQQSRMRHLEETLATFLRCYRNGRNGLGLVVMYCNTRQPPGNSNDYKIGKVAIGAAMIHRLVIVAKSPRTSSNTHLCTRRLCIATSLLRGISAPEQASSQAV